MGAPQDGGPAFPQITELREAWAGGAQSGFYVDNEGGMTLRDYFFASAMQGLLANPNTTEQWLNKGYHIISARAIADAMLAERQKGAQG